MKSRSSLLLAWLAALMTGCGTAAAAPTLAEALDQPGWSFLQEAGVGWLPVEPPLPTKDGVDAAQISDASAPAFTSLSTTVRGPGTLRFHWRLDAPPQQRELRFAVTNAWVGTGTFFSQSVTSRTPWTEMVVPLPAGDCVLTWSYQKTTTTAGVAGKAWLDQFSFDTAGTSVSLAEALDAPDLAWTTSGPGTWTGLVQAPTPGAPDFAVLDRPATAAAETTTLQTTVTGPGVLHYRVRLTGTGSLTSQVLAGATVLDSGVFTSWTDRLVSVPAGAQTLAWKITKPATSTVVARLDAVGFEPGTDSALAMALDTPGRTWTSATGGPAPTWDAALAHDGRDAVVTPATGSATYIRTAIAGPARVTGWVWNSAAMSIATTSGATFPVTFEGSATVAQGWRQFSFAVPPGSHQMQWTLGAGCRLDEIVITPVSTVPLANVLAAGNIAWAPTTGWTGATDAWLSPDGAPVAMATQSGSAPLEGTFAGAGTLSFLWRRAADDFGWLEIDGAYGLMPVPGATWQPARVEFLPGPHVARWFGGSLSALSGITWQPKTAPGMGDALDTLANPWSSVGGGAWTVTNAGSADGVDSLLSPALPAGGITRLMTVVQGTGTVSFKWRNPGPPVVVRVYALPDTGLSGSPSSTLGEVLPHVGGKNHPCGRGEALLLRNDSGWIATPARRSVAAGSIRRIRRHEPVDRRAVRTQLHVDWPGLGFGSRRRLGRRGWRATRRTFTAGTACGRTRAGHTHRGFARAAPHRLALGKISGQPTRGRASEATRLSGHAERGAGRHNGRRVAHGSRPFRRTGHRRHHGRWPRRPAARSHSVPTADVV